MSHTIDIQDDFFHSLLSDFLDESSQLMDRLNENLLQLDGWVREQSAEEKGTIDHDLLNEMFRSAHSIKGLSAMLGLPKINGLTHNIENVFDAARRGDLPIDDGVVEVIFGSIDRLGELIDHLRHHSSDDLDCDPQINRIRGLLQTIGADKQQGAQNAVEDMFPVPTPAAPLEPNDNVETCQSSPPKELTDAERTAIQSQYDAEFQSAVDDESVPLKYLAIFLDESEMSVDEIIDLLLGSDTCDDPAVIKSLLITSHRIKGSAASVGLNRPARLAHLMEDVLQSHRDHQRALSSDLTEALLCCADGLRTYLQGLKLNQAESAEFPRLAADLMIAEQECLLNPINISEGTDAAAQRSEVENPLSSAEAEAKVRAAASTRSAASNPVYLILVELDPNIPLIGLKAQLLYEKLGRLGDVFFSHPTASEPIERPISQAVFGIETNRTVTQIDAFVQSAGVLETLIQPLDGLANNGETGTAESTQNQPNRTESAASAHPEPKPAAETTEAPPTAPPPTAPPPTAPQPTAPQPKSPAPRSRPAESIAKPAETLRVDIERLDQLMNLAGQLVINKARFVQLGEGLRGALPHKQCGHWLATTEMQCAKLLQAVEPQRGLGGHVRPSDLDQAKSLTRQMQNGLSAIRREFARLQEVRASLSDFFEAIHQLDRVADGIQKSVMDTRMVPIGPLFGRFKRVVRDVSKTGEKQIELEILGEKTELDKRMIDELGDPLIHMVRNSADHGIESPAERKAKGKPAFGTVTLNAFHRGNSIIIQVTDDGRGLNRDKILAKAIEKGVVLPAEAEKLTPQQIFQLIWEPGFSTAEKVTEISGRGMGMDIVRSKIESINGVVEVDSHEGQGTVFTIRLPLTMAILPSLMARIDGDLFSVPVDSIVEIVKVRREDLRTVHSQPTAMVRGRVVSVVRLGDAFGWNGSPRDSQDSGGDITIVVLGQDGREVGLVVDGLLGEEDVVVKSLAENYVNIEGIAGACILGNGRVALILDPTAVIELAMVAGAKAATSGRASELQD